MMIYCAARFKPKKKRKVKGVVAKKYSKSSHILETNEIPRLQYSPRIGADSARNLQSLETDRIYTERRESLKYTGSLVKGIATMHKSNAVPIFSNDDAADIAHMRRN